MSPILLDLGFIKIYWYSVMILLGLFIGGSLIIKESKKFKIPEDYIINLIVGSNLSVTIITLLRLIYVLLYTSILTLTTPPTEITYGLEKLFLPLKLIGIPVNKMALSISLALRFIPTIIDQGNKIIKSQASRGIDYYNSNLKGKILAIKSLIIPMFALSIKKADDLADSMEVRLYNVNSKRINFRQNKWHFYDTFLVLMHLGLFILIMKEVVL